MDELIKATKTISKDSFKIKIRKPLNETSSSNQKKVATRELSKILNVIVRAVQPDGDDYETLKLATDALENLKKNLNPESIVDETLNSLIHQYQGVEDSTIRRAVLGEISNRLSLSLIREHVDSKISKRE